MKESIKNIISFWKIIINTSKKFVILLCLNIFFSAVVPFPSIILSKKVFDILVYGDSINEFFIIASILIILTVILNYLNAVFDSKVEIKGQQLMYSLSISYNLKSTNISYELLSNPQTLEIRELAGKAINGSNFIDMIRNVRNIISNILILIGVITLFIKVDLYIVLVVVVVISINTYANNLIKKAQYNHSIEVTPYMRKIAYIQSISSEMEYGKEIRLNSFKTFLLKKIEKLNITCFEFIRKIVNAQFRGIKISHITNGLQDFAVYFLFGYKVLVEKTMSIGDFSMYFNAIGQFKNSLTAIITTFTDIKISGLYMGHFLKYMELPDEQELEDEMDDNCNTFNNIRFENVSFKYPGHDLYVLKNINFKINKGEKLSIVGVNGSGKTTLIKLLIRLYKPTEGKIYLNNIDINDISYNKYVKYFSVVFQDFKLFAFSIKENICKEQNISDTILDDIMKKLNLLSKINSLPNKYETNYSRVFDEQGVEFSGGESQKLAIARAVYKDSPLIIMDEPTAALDPMAEYEIYRDFDKLTNGKTTIYISHRLSSCRFCDKILVLNDGKIKEYGSHNELLNEKGIYSEMYSKQAHFYIDMDVVNNNG